MKTTLLRFFVRFLGILPLPLLRALGAGAGWLLYRIPNRERETARVNLELCFPSLAQPQRERLLRQTLKETATTLLEMPAVWYRKRNFWVKRMEMGEVPGELRSLLAGGRGVIVVMPHIGNFELSAPFFGELGLPASCLYRPPRKSGLEEMMLEGRHRPGSITMLPTNARGVRQLYQALARGEFVGVLPDQQPKSSRGGAGVFAPFFGVPALTMTLVSRFAQKSGAPVYFLAFVRQPGRPGYRVIGMEGDPAIGSDDLETAVAALNAGVEALVRRHPEQYQWTYRRFERQPDGSNPYRRPG